MKKTIFIASSLVFVILLSILIERGVCYAFQDSSLMMHVKYQKEKRAKELKKKAEKYCSVDNFDKRKCKDACSDLKKMKKDRPKECDNSDGLPENSSGSAVSIKPVTTTKIDPLVSQKKQWQLQRQQRLDNLKQEKERIKQEFQERFTVEKCAQIQERMEERILYFNNTNKKYLSVYDNLISKINELIDKFKEAELDTSVIESHLTELQLKIDKFKNDFIAYKNKLEEVKKITCGHSEGEFKGDLLETKELLKNVHEDATEIRTYTQTIIFDDIKDLKTQMSAE